MALNRRDLLRNSGGVAIGAAALGTAAQAQPAGIQWDIDADVVVVGSGACGMTAAIVALEAGCSVVIAEREPHIGGHAITSGGNMPLGGGTSAQRKHGIVDSPDLLFRDLTDWSVVEQNGAADYRFNDREIIRAFADNSAATFDWLVAHGVVFVDKAPDDFGGNAVGNSAPREMHCAPMDWPLVQTGQPADQAVRTTMSTGNGLMRPLEAAARRAGVQIMLQHTMTALHREPGGARRIVGIAVDTPSGPKNIRAQKAVILGTGGTTSNVNFRRMFDPRLTEEYCGAAGMPWSVQDGSGEIAAMAVGASLWGLANQTGEFGYSLTKPGQIGCQYGYVNLRWQPGSPVFDRARAIGLTVRDWQDVILVNMLGNRIYDETGKQWAGNSYDKLKPYEPDSYRNAAAVRFKPDNLLNAALAGIGDGHNGGGPIWAIFDADAVAREHWDPTPPHVDTGAGFFFSADSLAELAQKIAMPHQRLPMPPDALAATVARYNGFVDAGVDADFAKPTPRYKIAARAVLRRLGDARCRTTLAPACASTRQAGVIDLHGEAIEGLFCGGESAGGFSEHGLARATCQGFIAGRSAAAGKA